MENLNNPAQNPECAENEICKNEVLKSRADEKREQRQKQKDKDPEYTKRESKKRQERRNQRDLHFQDKQILNMFLDKTLSKSKFSKMNKSRWEKLKQAEIDFLFSEPGFTEKDRSIVCLMEDRRNDLIFLQNNLDVPIGRNIFFFVETLVHDCKNQRKLTEDEKDYVKSLSTEKVSEKTKTVHEERKEYKREKSKVYYDLKKLNQKTVNLNSRFIKADPNRVLSIDEITNDPFVSNFSQREQHKIDLWKADENLEDLDKWRKMYEDYVLEVESLSIEYKEDFIKNKI